MFQNVSEICVFTEKKLSLKSQEDAKEDTIYPELLQQASCLLGGVISGLCHHTSQYRCGLVKASNPAKVDLKLTQNYLIAPNIH